ncbi:putative mitochondrial protein [Nicotiana attenuata]|uniref:Mitochondrial protein n=1 Tax=Nicotiana attenuata TaxID=49451 RepID=A0A314LG00_NICAT|nr:putative mitochondrial protein [Nicotiana attenuata]
MWNKRLADVLLSLGFLGSKTDSSLFYMLNADEKFFYLVYVDDILLLGSNSAHIAALISKLQTQFAIRDLGKLSYFLGIEANWTHEGLHLSHGKYVTNLLNRVEMGSCGPVSTQTSSSSKLSTTDGSPFHDQTLYKSTVGALQYLTYTIPDIAYAVNKVSHFMHCLLDSHWVAIKCILRYVKATSHGLFLSHGSYTLVHGYSDSDWGGDIDDRKSTTRFTIFLGSHLISWASRK